MWQLLTKIKTNHQYSFPHRWVISFHRLSLSYRWFKPPLFMLVEITRIGESTKQLSNLAYSQRNVIERSVCLSVQCESESFKMCWIGFEWCRYASADWIVFTDIGLCAWVLLGDAEVRPQGVRAIGGDPSPLSAALPSFGCDYRRPYASQTTLVLSISFRGVYRYRYLNTSTHFIVLLFTRRENFAFVNFKLTIILQLVIFIYLWFFNISTAK